MAFPKMKFVTEIMRIPTRPKDLAPEVPWSPPTPPPTITPLGTAVQTGDSKVCNSTHNTYTHSTQHAPHTATNVYSLTQVVSELFKAGADPYALCLMETPLHLSVSRSSIFDFFMQQKLNLEVKNERGDTLLHKAVQCRSLYGVKKLIEKGANIHALGHKDRTGTPLIFRLMLLDCDVLCCYKLNTLVPQCCTMPSTTPLQQTMATLS